MKDESGLAWLRYAVENRRLAQIALDHDLLNSSLQSSQQSVEKALKAAWIELGKPLRKTHSIANLAEDLISAGVDSGLTPEECDLLDSILTVKVSGDVCAAAWDAVRGYCPAMRTDRRAGVRLCRREDERVRVTRRCPRGHRGWSETKPIHLDRISSV